MLGDTRDEFDGSIWAQVTADHLGGLPPKVDLAREKLLGEVLVSASRDGLVSAAHDLSEGGLIQAVVEAALAGETGCRLVLPEGRDTGEAAFVFLFSESAARRWSRCPHRGEPLPGQAKPANCRSRGSVSPMRSRIRLRCRAFTVTLEELRSTSEGVLPGLFG